MRPRETVACSRISAASTNAVMTRAVNVCPIESAATSAIVIESSIVMRRSMILAIASRTMG